MVELSRRVAAEGLGTALLVAAVVGSGIMAERLTDDVALALLCNALATSAALVVLITVLSPISGAHLNPAVTLAAALSGRLPMREALVYAAMQIAGGVAGTVLAHAMFEMPLLELSQHERSGGAQWLSEAVATFGLVAVIIGGTRTRPDALPWLVGLYITSAYWFTASTSFANPAVTIARALTNSFAGIRIADVAAFVVAQLAGAIVALLVARWLFADVRQS